MMTTHQGGRDLLRRLGVQPNHRGSSHCISMRGRRSIPIGPLSRELEGKADTVNVRHRVKTLLLRFQAHQG